MTKRHDCSLCIKREENEHNLQAALKDVSVLQGISLCREQFQFGMRIEIFH